MFDTILLRYDGVFSGNEYNACFIQLVIDILQVVEDIVAFFSFITASTCRNFWSITSKRSEWLTRWSYW